MFKILVVFTGGTIACSSNNGVLSTDKKNTYFLLEKYTAEDKSVEFSVVQPYTILSENLNGEYLTKLYYALKENNITEYDGVIVTHGTDTLQYTSAFLSYMFSNSKTPIVVVSANYPLSDVRSNGFDNFCAAVDFIKSSVGSGVFTVYKNKGENPKIHRASRLLAHNAYDDKVFSIFDEFYGEIINHKFIQNTEYSECADEMLFPSDCVIGKTSDVLKVTPYPSMIYPMLNKNIKAVLLEGYHSGTLNTSGKEFAEFCETAKAENIPVFLTGACKGFYYESKTLFDSLGIKVLPPASPIAMYIKLWLLDSENIEKVYLSCGGDFCNI